MNADPWLLRRGLASLVASTVCVAIGLLLLADSWSTPTMEDVGNDSWVHGLVALPFIFVVLVPVSDMLGKHLLRTGCRSVLAFMRHATARIAGLALTLLAPFAVVAAVISFGTLRQVAEGLGMGVACLLILGLPAALAWRVIAGAGPSARTSESELEHSLRRRA